MCNMHQEKSWLDSILAASDMVNKNLFQLYIYYITIFILGDMTKQFDENATMETWS